MKANELVSFFINLGQNVSLMVQHNWTSPMEKLGQGTILVQGKHNCRHFKIWYELLYLEAQPDMSVLRYCFNEVLFCLKLFFPIFINVYLS